MRGKGYDSSPLLIDSLWTEENFAVQSDLVIAVPSRDTLFVTGSENAEGLQRIRKAASETVKESSYYLIPDLFVRKEGKWVVKAR